VTISKARQAYVNAVVTNFVRLPGTPLRASRRDRRLAAALHHRGIPLSVVWAALVVAATRWAIRGPAQRKLDQIRTLYYFVPAIEEMLAASPDADYVRYLAARLNPFVTEKDAILASLPLGQKAAFLDGR
jgi:hypothetical protein